jgi:5S rRNA maturation endonuclease (ribonuclease M5)
MQNYNFQSDNLDKKGFIDKKGILDSVSQLDIFELVFGFIPQDLQWTTSPFRKDTQPGCYFIEHVSGIWYFVDFGSTIRTHSDCFNIVQDYFQLSNFYLTLQFIYDRLIAGKEIVLQTRKLEVSKKIEKIPVKILIEPRQFTLKDAQFWTPYGISSSQLVEDKYFAISVFHALNTKKGNFSNQCYDIAYADTNYLEGRKKLYFPHRKGKDRFITTCTKEDIGGISTLAPFGKQLIITKSYKDWRVLKNQGKHAIYLQNEGMFPLEKLFILVKHWKEVIIFFDNDATGIEASLKLTALLNVEYSNKAKALWLPEILYSQKITDPSDLYKEQGKEILVQFLNQFT